MVPVLVGAQGVQKSSSVAALVPSPDFFTDQIHFDHSKDADASRLIRGKLVAEISELRGLSTGRIESIRQFVTRTHERWTPKYKEQPVTYARRLVMLGTSNVVRFLADPYGQRRWLPFRVSYCRPDAIARDRAQLWAEAFVLFMLDGIQFRDAERLAAAEHAQFTALDVLDSIVGDWLQSNRPQALHLGAVCVELGLVAGELSSGQVARLEHLLLSAGFTQAAGGVWSLL
jgi:predicted P-loop ATPase